jgi:hypothetical protein
VTVVVDVVLEDVLDVLRVKNEIPAQRPTAKEHDVAVPMHGLQ